LESLASTVTILPLGHAEVKAAASIRADLERRGKPIGPYDVLIAGTALAARGILVTQNTREFERIKGLQIEDWY
jgi:tRNA(fMet)-specific endonuclease VapC